MSREPLAGRSAYRHWHKIETQWADNDIYGHVNNTVHYRWFDTAVNSWLISMSLLDLENGNPIGLVVETGCRYAASITFPESVDIGLRIDRLGTSSVTFRLGVFVTGALNAAAQGHFTHVYVDRASRRPAPLPQVWRERMVLLTGD